ncbi:hypothetical protein PR048_000044 [Dryococelus australis]|uniref:Uncharacterized protein n=1 Tax=Dryococelus australis TaxID=614101 RepID=A0ABQ9IDI3_9NEOP|nr:hypothetical protein PR048_000044 [Dryococelus australis]
MDAARAHKTKYPAPARSLEEAIHEGESTRPLSSKAAHFHAGFHPKWEDSYTVVENQGNTLWVEDSNNNASSPEITEEAMLSAIDSVWPSRPLGTSHTPCHNPRTDPCLYYAATVSRTAMPTFVTSSANQGEKRVRSITPTG